MNSERYNNKITIYGSKKQIEEARQKLDKIKLKGDEAKDRLILQNKIVDEISADILYDGNHVYSKTKLLKHFKRLLKNDMQSLTNDLYKFFSLSCGSIAHYNKQGWIDTYPDLYALKEFFKHNEFGQSVLNHQPGWATDRIEIVKEMQKMLDALSAKIERQKDIDTEHKLNVLEESIKKARQNPQYAREIVKTILS